MFVEFFEIVGWILIFCGFGNRGWCLGEKESVENFEGRNFC